MYIGLCKVGTVPARGITGGQPVESRLLDTNIGKRDTLKYALAATVQRPMTYAVLVVDGLARLAILGLASCWTPYASADVLPNWRADYRSGCRLAAGSASQVGAEALRELCLLYRRLAGDELRQSRLDAVQPL